MRRLQLASQVATTRERLNWLIGCYSLGFIGGLSFAFKNKSKAPFVIAPLIIYGSMIGYQIDLAYFSKANRINNSSNEITKDESLWFIPIDITKK